MSSVSQSLQSIFIYYGMTECVHLVTSGHVTKMMVTPFNLP